LGFSDAFTNARIIDTSPEPLQTAKAYGAFLATAGLHPSIRERTNATPMPGESLKKLPTPSPRRPKPSTRSAGKRTPAESLEERSRRAREILRALKKDYPGAKTELGHEDAFQLLIATILSAQCTDERVNMVTPALFRRYPGPSEFAAASAAELESMIRSTGFYRMKAKNIMACCRALVERHGGSVPADMDALVQLPGVGRKTANVVLGQAFGIVSGVVVDTHVHRLSRRMGFTANDDPVSIERDLMEVFPQRDWVDVGSVLILHGRRVCAARSPKCARCSVTPLCPSREID
jgi:endonuclease-3